MKPRILYIELKTGYSDNGPAWIGKAEFSKTGQTVYLNNKALKKLRSPGISSNYFDIETGEEYWVSGVKKNGQNRHWYGGGKIMIDRKAVDEYMKLVDFTILDERFFKIIDFEPIDKNRYKEKENKPLNELKKSESIEERYWENNRKKLKE